MVEQNMRSKKSIINSSVNILAFIATFLPSLIVRKVFLTSLGSDLLGLTSLYTNIVGWLSIVELGLGSAIVYSLYKPFAKKEYDIIKSYVNFYGQFYRRIGCTILILGILISLFLNNFIKGDINLNLARIGLVLYVVNTFISYMFSHKICLLNLAQETYKITIGTTISKLIISLLQCLMLKYYPNFIIYILIQIFVNLGYFITINIYVLKKYSWINGNKVKLDATNKKILLKNVKAMFMHKIGSLVVLSTDNIIISKFVGLVELTIYTNYQMIITALQNLVSTGLSGITASIGNLIAEENEIKSYEIHKKVFFISFWLTSFIVISLYNTLNQFIVLWVGSNSLLDSLTLNIILINTYFSSMRGSLEQFQEGSGNFYQDRYAPICEAIINLTTSLILVKYLGILGVFIGTLISNFTVIFWTKPYVVYRYVFNKKISEYFKMYFKYVFIAIIPLILTSILTINIKHNYSIRSFILNCIINIVVINITYIIIFYRSDEFNYYLRILKGMLRKNNSRC